MDTPSIRLSIKVARFQSEVIQRFPNEAPHCQEANLITTGFDETSKVCYKVIVGHAFEVGHFELVVSLRYIDISTFDLVENSRD